MNRKKCSKPMDINGIEEWMTQFFTDPFTSLLDEQTFRLDLFETGEDFIVEAELGERVLVEEIKLEVQRDHLCISVYNRSKDDEIINRNIMFPFSIDKKKINATYSNGILEVKISKTIPSNQSSPCNNIIGN